MIKEGCECIYCLTECFNPDCDSRDLWVTYMPHISYNTKDDKEIKVEFWEGDIHISCKECGTQHEAHYGDYEKKNELIRAILKECNYQLPIVDVEFDTHNTNIIPFKRDDRE